MRVSRAGTPEAALHVIRLLISDFDGVMTDNRVTVAQDGRESVVCSRADGQGVNLLRAADVEVVIVSTEENPVVAARATKLGVEVIQGCRDKAEAVRELLEARELDPADAAFVGNDVNDLPGFAEVGTTFAPNDAHPSVREVADVVTSTDGGDGVIREIADLLAGGPQ